jgi:spermidine synthase
VRDVWEPVLKKFGRKDKTWLILGLAGGTIAGIIAKRFHPKEITGVEIDPVMVELGKKYLNLDEIPNLNIVVADAKSYIESRNPARPAGGSYFDFILVDMYLGDKIPEVVYSPKFLKRLKLLSNCVIFNHLFFDEVTRQKAGELVAKLKQIFPSVTLMRKLTNLLIICS